MPTTPACPDKIDAESARLSDKMDENYARLSDKIDAESARLSDKMDAQHAETMREIRRLFDALLSHSHDPELGIIFPCAAGVTGVVRRHRPPRIWKICQPDH